MLSGRVSALSATSRASPEVTNILNVQPGVGKLKFEVTPSRKNIKIDPDHVVFKTSSMAVLHAKGRTGTTPPTRYNNGQKDTQKTDDDFFQNESTGQPQDIYSISHNNAGNESYLEGARRVLDFMFNLWREKRMCDVIIHTSFRDVVAHKVALGAYSDALAEKFSEFPVGEIISIDLSDIKAETVQRTLMFIYTTDISLNDDNVGDILFCATELGVDIVIRMCVEHLVSSLSAQNAFTFFEIAEEHDLDDLKWRIKTFIINNFTNVIKSKDFVHIPFDKLVHLLSSDDLEVSSELAIFRAIVRWVDQDRQERLKLAAMLLKCVRFQLLSVETLVTQVEVISWVFATRDCHNWLYDAIRFHALKGSGGNLAATYSVQHMRHFAHHKHVAPRPSTPPRQLPQTPESVNPTLHYLRMDGTPTAKGRHWPGQIQFPDGTSKTNSPFSPAINAKLPKPLTPKRVPQSPAVLAPRVVAVAVGGMDLSSIDPDVPGRFLYKFDPFSNEWKVLTTLQQYIHHHGVTTFDGKLFVIGGAIYNQATPDRLGQAVDSVQIFNPDTRSWSMGNNMKERRSYHAVSTWRRYIYAVGGENENKIKLDSIECYDGQTDTWRYVARMIGGAKIGMAVATFQDHLYVVGGYNKDRSSNSILADVECFDLQHERWIKKRPLTIPRCHASLIAASGKLFLIGGRTQTTDEQARLVSLASIEVYDPSQDTWEHVANLAHARHDAGCFSLGSNLYIAGGLQTPNPFCLTSVECYNTETYQRTEGVAPLLAPAAGVACTTLLL